MSFSICFGCSFEMVLLSTHNICFGCEIRKLLIFNYSHSYLESEVEQYNISRVITLYLVIIYTGDFLPISRGPISVPFPIENIHIFSQCLVCFSPIKKSKKKKKKIFKRPLLLMRNNDPYQNET